MTRGHGFFVTIIACMTLGVIVVPALAQGTSDFMTGVQAYQKDDYKGAVTSLEAATKADPKMEAAWYYLGQAQFKLGDFKAALAAFQKSVELMPGRPGTRLYIGEIYEAQGDFNDALRVYEEELRLRRGKDVLPVQNAIGRALYENGQYDQAIAQLTEVVKTDPRFVESMFYLGLSESAMGDNDKAVNYFKSALKTMTDWQDAVRRLGRLRSQQTTGEITSAQQREIGETQEKLAQDYSHAQQFGNDLQMWPTLNKSLGNAYLALQEYSRARNAYRGALDKDQLGNPSDPDAFTLIGLASLAQAKEAFTNQGLLFQAIDTLTDAIKSEQTALAKNANYAQAHNALGEIYMFQAQTYVTNPTLKITSHSCGDADKEFQAALKADPKYVDAMYNMAKCLLLTGKNDEAKAEMDKALALAPKRADLHAEMAEILLALEQPDAALKEAQTALGIDHNNAQALNAAGTVYMYSRGDIAEAIDYFSRATTVAPKDWQGYLNLGLAFFQMESWYRARHEFEHALKIIPTATIANTAQQQAYLYYVIGRTYHETNQYDQEITALNEALGRFPSDLDTLKQLARAYEAQGKYRASEQVLQDALKRSPSRKDDPALYVQLAGVYEKEGRLHEAITAYTEALNIDPNNLAAQQGLSRLQPQPVSR